MTTTNLKMKIYVSCLIFTLLGITKARLDKPISNEKPAAKLPPCSACTTLVKSFENGLERTSRGKLEGGDTAWEEKNQGKGYATSEVRFVEIQEKLCRDVSRGEIQVNVKKSFECK